MDFSFPSLTTPLNLRGGKTKNRLVHASVVTQLVREAQVTPELIQYYLNRARGGAGMVVTEPLSFAPHQDLGRRVRAWDDSDIDGLKRWAAAIEAEDCRIVAQLFDRGRGRNIPGRSTQAISASALPDDMSLTMPRALEAGEIESMVEAFASTAYRLKRCGFSGVEISAGHGHLFHQFLSPRSNIRQDKYGGSLEGRCRFVVETAEAIRNACGKNFLIGLKLPGDDGVENSIGIAESRCITAHVVQSVDASYVVFAQGSHARSLDMHVPDGHTPRLTYMPLLAELRDAAGDTPVMALGRIKDPAEAERIVSEGAAELVGLGRSLIADPAWLKKAVEGRTHAIRYCVSCNTCWERITAQASPIACDNNPQVAKPGEVDFWPSTATRPRRVVVVGAGIAGMEAAWTLAARGHDVTVLGASRDAGGKARLHAQLPGNEDLSSVYDYQLSAAQKAGAKLDLGRQADTEAVLRLRPDAVVLATGSTMVPPEWLPEEVRQAGLIQDLRKAILPVIELQKRQPGVAVVYDTDQSEGTYAAVELLASRFEQVALITPREGLCQFGSVVTRQGVIRRMFELGINIQTLSELRWSEAAEDGDIECYHLYTGATQVIKEVSFIAWSTPRSPNDELKVPLEAAGIDVHLVGDTVCARDVLAAISEGHAAGMRL